MSFDLLKLRLMFIDLFGRHATWMLSEYVRKHSDRQTGRFEKPTYMPSTGTLLPWAKSRMLEHPDLFSSDDLHFKCYERRVSAGNENPPPGHWISIEEHGTAILHTGSLFFLDCPFGGHHEEIDPTYQSTRLPKIREKFNPTPIDTTASRVTNTKKRINHRGPQ